MTVSTTLDEQYFPADGVNVNFPFNFKFLDDDDIFVWVISPTGDATLKTRTTDYTLTGELNDAGGQVTMLVAPALTVPATRVLVRRIVPQTQPTSIRNQGKFFPEVHENVFDRLTMLIQQALSGVDRSIHKNLAGTGWDFQGLPGVNLANPVNQQDAATLYWVQQYIGSIISQGQGPINSAVNVLYVGLDGVPRTVQDMSNQVSTNLGAVLLGRGVFAVESVKELLSMPRFNSQVAVVKSYFPGSDLGYGLFRWVSTAPKTGHDGGLIISPTVPWDGTVATHAAFLAGTGESSPGGTGCWVRMTESTFGTHFGMTATAASAALQKMLMAGGRKQFPDGVFRLATVITRDFSTNDTFPEPGDQSVRFTLEGQSISNSILHYAGAGFAMNFIGSKDIPAGQNVHSMVQISKFALKPADAGNKTCSGIRMINHAYTSLRDLDLEYLDTGLELKSVITCDFERLYVRSCTVGLSVNGAGFSMPNANDFRRFTAQSCTYAGVVCSRIGGGFHMQGGTIESNGTMGAVGTGGFVGNIDGVNGSATLSLTNFYFEANAGDADLLLENVSPYTVTVLLTNVNFNRTSNTVYTKNNIKLSNSGGGKIILVLNGVSFMRGGTYVANADRPYIQIDNACEIINNGITYRDEVELNHSLSSSPTVSGRVQSNGAALSMPVGITSARISVGLYRITSTVGFGVNATGYVATAVSTEAAGGIKVERITQTSATIFDVVLTNTAGALADGAFNFTSTRMS